MRQRISHHHRRLMLVALAALTLLSSECGAGSRPSSVAVKVTTTTPTTPSTTNATTTSSTIAVPTSTTAAPRATTTTTKASSPRTTPTTHSLTTTGPATTSPAAFGACPATLPAQMAATGGGSQLITVVVPSTGATTATVTLWQRSGSCWTSAGGPWTAWVGYNGTTASKVEGDGKTPLGLFSIGSTFYGTAPNPGVHGAYHSLVCGDWWDEEPSSPEYNTFQHVSSCSTTNPFGGGSEALWVQTTAYASFAVIDYNISPILPGKGSAIFLHYSLGHPTNGCVSLPGGDQVATLRWLQPGDSPHIAIGTAADIRTR